MVLRVTVRCLILVLALRLAHAAELGLVERGLVRRVSLHLWRAGVVHGHALGLRLLHIVRHLKTVAPDRLKIARDSCIVSLGHAVERQT